MQCRHINCFYGVCLELNAASGFFAVVCISRILTLSKKPLCQPPDAYVYLLPILLFVRSFCFSGLNEPTCLKHWWGWRTFTAASLSFISSVEVYKFLLTQNQGTNFFCFPFTPSTWVGRGNIIKGMKSFIILTLQSRGYGRSAIPTSWFWILLMSSSSESSVAVGWTFPAVNRPQNELKFTELSAAK